MAKATSTTAVDEGALDEADALFGSGAGVDAGDDEFADAEDLLGTVQEDDAEAWNPTERGEKISGVIVKVGQTKSDFAAPGTDPMVPTVTIQNRDGKFRVIGFASVLHREIEDAIEAGSCVPGNLFASVFWGDKPIKKGQFAGKSYKHYSVVCQKPSKRG